MSGRISMISGATVRASMTDVQIGDRVFVGHARLTGEVVRLDARGATIQVFEETKGLGVDEPVVGSGGPMTVSLGPGLLGSVFDGLQRPLHRLRREHGDFIAQGRDPFPLSREQPWRFTPTRQAGDSIRTGDLLGHVQEGHLQHPVVAVRDGVLAEIAAGEFEIDAPVARLEDGQPVQLWHAWPVRKPLPVTSKRPPTRPMVTGQRCLDFLYPLAKGGIAVIPGGFGTGKTVLEQTIAKFADVDVVVYVGCGERGNEMAGLLDEFLELRDPDGKRPLMERTIIVANTSNMPVAARESSIFTAVTMAEYYRDMGLDVLFLADSLSRWAEALREISSALEEMPGEDGYPTYLGSRLAEFIERAGVVSTRDGRQGSLSMVLAVSPPGADFAEPVTQACLRVAGAFWMLDTRLAHRRHFPAIHWGQSYSLYAAAANRCWEERHERWAELQTRCRDLLQREEALREVAEVVGMEGLQARDRLLMEMAERIRLEFLCQNSFTEDAFCPPEKSVQLLAGLIDSYDQAARRLADGDLLDDVLREVTRASG